MYIIIREIIKASELKNLSDTEKSKLMINKVMKKIKVTCPNASPENGLIIQFHPLENGDLSIKGKYYEDW